MNPNSFPLAAPNCSFVLDNGQPCRAPARHESPFCRHHSAEARARRRHASSTSTGTAPAAVSAEPSEISPWRIRAYWRMHHRLIPTFGPEELDGTFDMILGALDNRQIAARSAGRLLLAIFDRRRELALEAQEATLRALRERALRQQSWQSGPRVGAPSLEGRNNYPVSVAGHAKTQQVRL